MEHVIIIGGGGTGAALAHDLSLRGFEVSLFEKGGLVSGTTGRHHGLLHSGARYAVHDPGAARECARENAILRTIAPGAIEQNGGLFVAIDDADVAYARDLIDHCRRCDVPVREIALSHALTIEPALTPDIRYVLEVSDATVDAWRLPLQFFATARAAGAAIHQFSEVTGILRSGDCVTGVRVRDHRRQIDHDVTGDVVVNAAGAWAGLVSGLAGIPLSIQPAPGAMVSLKGRLTDRVINRLHRPGEGDIIVPQRNCTILGTSIWHSDDPDSYDVPPEDVERLIAACAVMVPSIRDAAVHAAWSAVRPLMGTGDTDLWQASRDFECYDHAVTDNLEGLVSVIGGKATTMRSMAEETADLICRKTGRDIPCRTATEKLLNYRLFYRSES